MRENIRQHYRLIWTWRKRIRFRREYFKKIRSYEKLRAIASSPPLPGGSNENINSSWTRNMWEKLEAARSGKISLNERNPRKFKTVQFLLRPPGKYRGRCGERSGMKRVKMNLDLWNLFDFVRSKYEYIYVLFRDPIIISSERMGDIFFCFGIFSYFFCSIDRTREAQLYLKCYPYLFLISPFHFFCHRFHALFFSLSFSPTYRKVIEIKFFD